MTNTLQTIITKSPILAVFIVFWAGFIASLSSCTIIRIPIVFGYVSGASHHTKRKSFLSALCLTLGLITSYTFHKSSLRLLTSCYEALKEFNKRDKVLEEMRRYYPEDNMILDEAKSRRLLKQ